jgi:hypothetical protein
MQESSHGSFLTRLETQPFKMDDLTKMTLMYLLLLRNAGKVGYKENLSCIYLNKII